MLNNLYTDAASLLSVSVIDIVLSGDNAVVIGMAAASLPILQRRKAILFGLTAGAALRIGFSLSASFLLTVRGLPLVGGLALLWVCNNLYKELTQTKEEETADRSGDKTLWLAIWQILIADVSMSLDNVLAVAGISQGRFGTLVFGLVLSVFLMAVAASFIARSLDKHKWIGWLGLSLILYVAGTMIFHGLQDILQLQPLPIPHVDIWELQKSWEKQ